MDHSTSSGDEDRDRRREQLDHFVRASSYHHREGNNEGRQYNNRHHYHHHHHHNSRDYDTRSQSSQKSDPNSETGGKCDPSSINYNPFATESVGSHGSSGGGDRGFPLHGHGHFGHPTMSAAHLLNGDPAHQFPPSLYQASADAPKSDTATVCSSSMLEDIEDVSSHYDGEAGGQSQTSNNSCSKQQQQHQHHHYPPPTYSSLRRSNSAEGNRLVDFAHRSQVALRAVFPKQSKSDGGHVASLPPQESSSSSQSHSANNDEDAAMAGGIQHRKGMGPPLSRHWLLQQHGSSPFRTGSVKSSGSNTGSDVVVNVGSDCGGSLTDVQSILSQEDAALLTTANSEVSNEAPPIAASDAAAATTKMDTLDTSSSPTKKKPHPLLCDQSDSKTNGRTSPGGTIYRGRGVRRYKGRFYALPLKRFHQDGVHLHSDSEPEGTTTTYDRHHQSRNQQQHDGGDYDRWEDHYSGNFRDDDQRGGGGGHNYYGHESSRHTRDRNRGRDRDRDRSRGRSRSRSPPSGDRRRETRNRNLDQTRGYKIDKKNDENGSSSSSSRKKPPRRDRDRL